MSLCAALVFSSSEARQAWKMRGGPCGRMDSWRPAFLHVSRMQHPDSRLRLTSGRVDWTVCYPGATSTGANQYCISMSGLYGYKYLCLSPIHTHTHKRPVIVI